MEIKTARSPFNHGYWVLESGGMYLCEPEVEGGLPLEWLHVSSAKHMKANIEVDGAGDYQWLYEATCQKRLGKTDMPVANEPKHVIDKFHIHEALDRAGLMVEMVESVLLKHPFIESQPKLRNKVEKASELLATVYQLIGASAFNNEED
jgi:hypothetical protein